VFQKESIAQRRGASQAYGINDQIKIAIAEHYSNHGTNFGLTVTAKLRIISASSGQSQHTWKT
jgi:hypothetical protein